jgi:hypothetical protein
MRKKKELQEIFHILNPNRRENDKSYGNASNKKYIWHCHLYDVV